ncbi:MAG: DUF4149 domain-containing protein [Candidatus Methylomirabilales bacterium]
MSRNYLILLTSVTGAWLGAMVFVSFAVAPIAFATLESRHQAGDLVAATLNVLYLSGYILGPLLVLVSAATRTPGRRLLWGVRTVLLILMSVSTLVARELVGAKLSSVRRAMGRAIEQVPLDDPLRVLFQQWHHVSVLLMLFNIAAALAVLLLLCFERSGQARS